MSNNYKLEYLRHSKVNYFIAYYILYNYKVLCILFIAPNQLIRHT